MIYRGTQKKMIVLKRTGSPFFEEAYFILREGGDDLCAGDNAMALEAERIVSRMERREEERIAGGGAKKRVSGRALWFLAGALCGIGAVFILRCIVH